MAKSIEKRLEKIEQTLGIKQTPRLLILIMPDHEQQCKQYGLPLELNDWITYKQAKAKTAPFVLFMAEPAKEIEARQQLQNETK